MEQRQTHRSTWQDLPLQSLPHGEFNVVVVETSLKVQRAEDPLLLLLELLNLSEPEEEQHRRVSYQECFLTKAVDWGHVHVLVCYLGAIDPYFCEKKRRKTLFQINDLKTVDHISLHQF